MLSENIKIKKENNEAEVIHYIKSKNGTLKTKKPLETWKKILIILSFLVFVAVMALVIIKIIIPRKKSKPTHLEVNPTDTPLESSNRDESKSNPVNEEHNYNSKGENINAQNIENDGEENTIPTVDELKEFYKPSFKINSNLNSLTQMIMKYKRNIITKSDNKLDFTFIKAKINTYIMSELTQELNDGSNFYEKKITAAVVINSLCASSEVDNCEYISYLDLTVSYEDGEEEDEDNRRNLVDDHDIEDLTLPLCLIEYSDTNIIFSISCPKNLESNLKTIIIEAFESMKPKTIKGDNEDKTFADTTIEERDNKIFVNSFSKICEIYEKDTNCETNLDIITDKDGNFISCNKIKKIETDSLSNEHYIEITPENTGTLEPNVFKTNLNNILNFIGNNMEKETYTNANTLEEIISEAEHLRNLSEDGPNDIGKQENNVFCTEFGPNKVCLSLSNNMLKGDDESETSSSINYNNNTKEELSSDRVSSNITTTINEFKSLSKAANSLSTELFNKIINLLVQLTNTINSEFTSIEELLAHKDLSSVFDSTFTIAGITEFPYTIVSAAKNLYSNIKILNDDLLYSIDDYKTQLKDGITSFLANSHTLMNIIFNNLKGLTNALSSTKSKIANIAAFYEYNGTNTSFVSVIENANNILANYYIEEKNLIGALLNNIFGKFLNSSKEKIENSHYIFDNIINKLESKDVVINRGDENDIKSVIDNLYNTKILENKIPINIVDYMKKNIIQSNGYFVTEKVIEDNNKSFSSITENALIAAKGRDNCEYIDETSDEIMKFFRQQFITILKNMDKSKVENFPIKTNVLDNTPLKTSFNEFDEFLKNEKVNINNLLKTEDKNFMELIKEKIDLFISKNKSKLDNIIKNIYEHNLSKLNLANIDVQFYKMLNYTKNNIENIIKNNNDLSLQYMEEIKNTTHLTNAITNKVKAFEDKLNEINSYINKNLKNDLMIKYKNIINQIRQNLQTIKSNTFTNKYNIKKDLSFFKTHINNYIEPLFLNLDEIISDNIFNTKYIPIINDFIEQNINIITQQKYKLNELYKPFQEKAKKNDNVNDTYYISCNKCCSKRFLGICVKKTTYHSGKTVDSTLNYDKIKSISFSDCSKDFDNYYNQFYSTFSNNIITYNNIISILDEEFKNSINDYSNKKIDYLNSLSQRAKSFLNEQLGLNILKSSYNYYKNDLKNKLPVELNSILQQWKSVYNKVYQDINSNIDKFKYPLGQFSNLATIYYSFYYYNISYFYSDSVIEQRKSDFNFTIKYYYNLFLSKINKTYSYIINNMPKNEKPFDNLLNYQIEQIKNSKEEILNLFTTSLNEILNITKQLNILKVSETNFFDANSYAIDVEDTIEEELSSLVSDFEDISYKANNKYDSIESVASCFYLENMINGNQTNELYEAINKGTFIEFQTVAYQNLFEETLEIDEIDLKNKILEFFTKYNEELNNIFENKNEKYKNMLQNEIFTQFYNGKNALEKKINSLYSEGLNDLDINSKNKILKYIDDIIESIKNHMINEKERLTNDLTSYSNNYNVFVQRLNKLENEIFNKFYTAIFSVPNSFYSNINKKFYTDYIEKYLEQYYNNTMKEKFSEHAFLNITLNLKEKMDENIETLTSEYKNWTLSQLIFLNNKTIQNLNELFSISTLKNDIKKKIDNLYKTLLLDILKEKAIYTSGNEGILDYDFSETILNDINSVINEKIADTNKIVEKMKGNKYDIEEELVRPDFNKVERKIFKNITDDFNTFTEIFDSKEKEDFKKEITKCIKSNFKQILDNFVPSFAKDFFERVLKFNEIQKIQSLYQNLKYSIGISLSYYLFLTYTNSIELMPKDLEIKILSLNNIDSVINSKNNQILSILNSKFDEFLELITNNFVEKYINYMKNDITLINSFNISIIDFIKILLENNRFVYGNEYKTMMNSYIKNPFIKQYSKTIQEATNNMINYIQENKELLRIELKDLLIIDKDETLNNIEIKLNDTLEAIENYKSHFKSVEISENIKNFLDTYVESNILPKHQEIKNILDSKTKNLVIDYLNKNSEDFKKSFNFERIGLQLNNTDHLFKNEYFDIIIQSLKEYGVIDSIYLENLEKKLIDNSNSSMRLLEENNEKIVDLKLDKTYSQLKESSQNNKQFVETTNIFSDFNKKIDKYIKNIEEQYEVSKNTIKKQSYTEEENEELYQSLEELKDLSISYYNKVKINYDKIKENIEKSILNIDKFIQKSYDITNNTIYDKYKEISNNYNAINNKINKEEKKETTTYNNDEYQVQIKINDFLYNNEFIFYTKMEGESQQFKGKSINKNRPKSFVVDFSSKFGKCIMKGKEITVNLNDVYSILNIDYNISSAEANLIKEFYLEPYYIDNKFYNETTIIISKRGPGGIPLKKETCVRKLFEEIPDGEKEREFFGEKNETLIEKLL